MVMKVCSGWFSKHEYLKLKFCSKCKERQRCVRRIYSDCEEFRCYSGKANKNSFSCKRLLVFSLANYILVSSLWYNTSLMILQWRKLLWWVDYTVWCFVSKWRCLDYQLKALQCCFNSTDSHRRAFGEVFSQTEQTVAYLYYNNALEHNWEVRTLIKEVVQKCIFQNDSSSTELFLVLLLKRTESKTGDELGTKTW